MSVTDPYAAPDTADTLKNVKIQEPTPETTPKQEPEVPVQEESKGLSVPDGNIDEVLEWVGDDKERAEAALEAEETGSGRVTLIRKLEELLEDLS